MVIKIDNRIEDKDATQQQASIELSELKGHFENLFALFIKMRKPSRHVRVVQIHLGHVCCKCHWIPMNDENALLK